MTNPIVTVNVSQVVAPVAANVQKKGAILSQGGTTLADDGALFLTKAADLTSSLTAPAAITSLAWSGGTVTATTTSPHGVTTSDVFLTRIAGATPAVYNGTFVATATGASTFTYALVSDGGTTPATGTITYTPRGVAELLEQVTTFFAQGSTQGVTVLELGDGEPAAGVTALSVYIAAQPTQPFYAYMNPRSWDGVASFLTFLGTLQSDTSKTYFFTTTTSGTYTDYAAMKNVVWEIQAPGTDASEFSLAAAFYAWLNYTPSTTTKVTPFAFTYQYGVTPYPLTGNAVLLTAIKAAFGNVIGTGAEGGITTSLLAYGTTGDGRDATYWYSVDWAQFNIDITLSNAVINGSNNPTNPLYLNQSGITRLQQALVGLMSQGVSYGLVLGSVTQTSLDQDTFNANFSNGDYAGQCVVNAIPFSTYYAANPSDYAIGKYAGFTVVYTPNRGFTQIIVNVVVTDFVAQ